MSESSKEEKKPDSQTGVLKKLDTDKMLVLDNLHKFKKNKNRLVQIEIWKEMAAEVPMRAKASLVLVVILIAVVIWVQSSFSSAQTSQNEPTATRMAVINPKPSATVTPTPASLESSGVSDLQSATASDLQAVATNTPEPLFVFHTVQAEETLISIAAQYNLTTELLLAANDIRDPTALEEGQVLLIPPDENGVSQQKIVVHQANKGDTLLSIATKYGSSVKDILAANPNLVDAEPAPNDAVAVPIVFVLDNPAVNGNGSEDTVYHVIQPGEIPLTIAAEYDIPVDILLTANDITDPRRLQVGQQLIIPPHDGISLGFPVILYEILETDTLVGMASRFGSSVKDILAVNPELNPASLEVGELVAIPVIFAPKKPTPEPSAPRPTPGPPPPGITELNEQLVQAVNVERELHGLPSHTFDGQLAEVALGHAQDMYVRDFFAHVNPSGETLRDRLQLGGVANFTRAGENIQRNTQPKDETVQAAVNWFMNSPPHRANMLHQHHNRIGVAIVEGPPGWYTFVLVFAER